MPDGDDRRDIADDDVTDIEGVLVALGRVVDRSVATGSRIGYFASLYRQVTVAVAQGIDRDEFEDGPRMSRFDAAFGNRYLRALRAWREEERSGQPVPGVGRSWRRAFRATGQPGPVILQHLVLGVNAHINLDLAVAAAETCPGEQIGELKKDFDHINAILNGVLGVLQDSVGELSPVLAGFDRTLGRLDEQLFGFSVVEARAAAWEAAEDLAHAPPEGRAFVEGWLDRQAALLAGAILKPLWPLPVALQFVRRTEPREVAETIRHLDGALERAQRSNTR
jgi:hypothetical protein